jgi:cation diffusion facilitator CzcD-associated flavoprotein CzcO
MTQTIDCSDRHCIIGAGPGGLVQARALRWAGLPFDVLERHKNVGGLWDIDNPTTAVYASAHFVSSRTQSGFLDFPMPDTVAEFPGRVEILDYLRAFADAYDLKRHIQFSSPVQKVEPQGGLWHVTVGDQVRVYRSVICATGMHSEPVLPQIPGRFSGTQRHSMTYRTPDEFRDQRVLIVGAGNSGCDIATEAARNARAAYISMRRGYHFLPKTIFGKPADVYERENEWMPFRFRRWVFTHMLRVLLGDLTRYGLQQPEHRLFETQPILNSDILHCLAHGSLSARPDIERLDGKRVRFVDGSSVEVDQIVYATGYRASLPYLDASHVEWHGHGLGHFLTCFSRRHANLFTLGFFEGNAAVFPQLELLAVLIARFLRAQEKDPATAQAMRTKVEAGTRDLTGPLQMIDSPRHTAYTDWHTFRKRVRALQRDLRWPAATDADFRPLRGA